MSGDKKEPVLTAEQVQRIWEIGGYNKPAFEAELQRMGLFEPKPLVDIELGKALENAEFLDERNRIPWANGFRDGFRRGMELAPAARLTREMVAAAWAHCVSQEDFVGAFHTALTQQMKEGE